MLDSHDVVLVYMNGIEWIELSQASLLSTVSR
jgi:hypothetical protein